MIRLRSPFLAALLSLLALPALADSPLALPAAATPTLAPSLAPSLSKPAKPTLPPPRTCRPGTQAVVLQSSAARWSLSPCSGAVEAVRLLQPQFQMGHRQPPPGLPAWAGAKYAEGPLDLVPTWDPPWDPFQDRVEKVLVGGQDQVQIQRQGETQPHLLNLEALQKSEPEWKVLQHDAAQVAMIWPDPAVVKSPLYLVKTFTLAGKTPDGHEQPLSLHVELAAWNLSGQPLQLTLRHAVTTYQDAGASSGGLLAMFSAPPDNKGAGLWQGGQLLHQDVAGLNKAELAERTKAGKPDWLGVDSRYFLLASIPLTGFDDKTQTLLMPRGATGVQAQLTTAPTQIAPATCMPSWYAPTWGGTPCADDKTPGKLWTYQTFAGPKQLDLLHEVDHDLAGSIDFGWFGVIARPMLGILRFAHDITGLWPLAILILTVLVKLILWPVTARSMQSMKKMQQLKPALDKVRKDLEEKAKKLGQAKPDPQELNRATFELYKQHNVNPLGGCLPLLLQMPIYIALYRTINSSVELFNQPLFGWITDLTAKDPYYVLPLVLGGVMFAQQKLTPQAGGDPAQQKMMLYFMPILFTAMMLQLPSGLTLYILANTALSVLQTLYVNRAAKG